MLGQLLGDSTTTTCLSEHHHGTHQRLDIHTRMVVETHIFCSDEGVDHIRRDIGVVHAHAVLVAVVTSEQLHVAGDNLGGILVLRVLQLIQWGQVTQPTLGNHPKQYND